MATGSGPRCGIGAGACQAAAHGGGGRRTAAMVSPPGGSRSAGGRARGGAGTDVSPCPQARRRQPLFTLDGDFEDEVRSRGRSNAPRPLPRPPAGPSGPPCLLRWPPTGAKRRRPGSPRASLPAGCRRGPRPGHGCNSPRRGGAARGALGTSWLQGPLCVQRAGRATPVERPRLGGG